MEIVSFSNAFKNFDNTTALNDISFTLNKNRILGIVGNNGAGKTTIIKILCNLLRYDKGEVRCFSNLVRPNLIEYRKRIGIVLSDHPLIDAFKSSEYLNFVGRFQDVGKSDLSIRIKESLLFFDIADKQIKTLSSGNRARLAIASSLIHNPELLVYDEPFNFLDISSTNAIKNFILSLKGKKSMIITSHNLEALCEICDEMLIVDCGKIIKHIEIPIDRNIGLFKEELIKYFGEQMNKKDLSWIE